MGNALEFILKLTDLLSPAMRQAASISDSAAGRIEQDMNRVTSGANNAASGVSNLTNQVTRLRDEQGRFMASNKGGGMFGGITGSMMQANFLTGLIQKAGDVAQQGIGAILQGGAKREQDLIGLKTFLGAAGAKEAYANIQKDASVTPFDTESLLMVNRALISAGVNAKDARTDTMNLANAISAVGGGNAELSRMAVNMQQIKTVGKATQMDIKQFAFAGINIYKILADATGKNINQVKDMEVSYDLLSKALARASQEGGAYYGALEAQGKSITGKQSTLMDNLKIAAADIGTSLQPILHWLLDIGIRLTGNFSNIASYVKPVVDWLNSIPSIMDSITSPTSQWASYIQTISGFASAVWETIKSLAGTIWNIVSGVIEFVGKSAILKDVFFVIGAVAQGLLWMVTKIGDAIGWIWDNIIKPIIEGIDRIYAAAKSLVGMGPHKQVINYMGDGYTLPNVIAPVHKNDPLKTGNTSPGAATDLGKSKADSINGGGQRSIVINIGKQVERLEMHVMNAKEGVDEVAAMIREALRRELYSLNGVVNG
jgi:tape measure domain-containing protein